MKLELGGGRKPKEGFKNLDIIKEADIVCDLELQRIPLADESVDEIYSNHTLEHIQNIIHVMNECWRVLRWGGMMEVKVPYYKSTIAWADPTHKRYWTEESIKYFCGEYLLKWELDYGIKCCFKLEQQEITAPDGRPEYFQELRFVLKKEKEHFAKLGWQR